MKSYATLRTLGVLALTALAACSDGAPTGVITPPPTPGVDRPDHVPPPALFDSVYVEATITCNGTRSPATLSCSTPQSPTTFGGKGTHVRVFTDSVSYSAGLFQFRMRFRNMLVNRMGTADGPTTDGIMAFVTAPPTTTGGSGVVAVTDADSIGTFTAANQPYMYYDTLVASGDTTMWRRWKLNVPGTVNSFQLKVYLSAPLLPVIVFDKETGGNRDIWRANLDGTDLVQLTTQAGTDMDPTAANGRVVWVSYRNGNAELYSMALTGGGQSRLTVTTTVNETAPALALNGTKLAYVSDASGVSKVWIGDFTGTTLTNGAAVTNSLGNVIENGPAWDRSTRILYTGTAGATSDLYFYTPGNAAPTLNTISSTTAADVEPAFSHDGIRYLWATTRDAGDTEVYWRQGTTTLRQTTHVGVDAQPTFLSDFKMVWVEEGSPTILRWGTYNPTTTGTIPTGAGSARNPYGVPLHQ
jgi:hypothetical protein